jgi:hypothetical protein
MSGRSGDDPVVSDRYRVLRTRVVQLMKPNGWRTLGVTSPGARAGKTLTSINLALSLARDSAHDVILVDADLRKSSLGRDLGVPVEHGMLDYLTQDDLALEDVLVSIADIPNLWLIDRNSLQAMFRTVYANNEIPSKTIVEMTNLELPISNENAVQFEKYLNHEHQIIGQMDELIHGYIELFEQGDSQTKQSVLDIFWGTTIEQEQHATQMNLPQIDEITKTDKIWRADEVLNSDEASKLNGTENSEGELARLFPRSVRNQIADVLFEMGLDEEKCEQVRSGNILPTDVLKHMNAILSQPEIELKNSFISLLNSKEMSELLEKGIQRQWTLEPKDVEEKERIQDFYKKILNETDRTEKLLVQLEKTDSSLMKNTENLRTNVSFMNQMNQIYHYVQLPLKLSEENCHGDFYVYRNRKKQALEDGSISALLHLEMERLGTVDIHVTLKDGNQVKTHFYLEKDELLDFMEEHLYILDERLTKKGYHMSTNASVRKREENGNHTDNVVIDEMFPNEKNATTIVKYSFDMRA